MALGLSVLPRVGLRVRSSAQQNICVKPHDVFLACFLRALTTRHGAAYFFFRNAFLDEGRDCEYFTMMRNPIDRALSAFFYCPTDHDVQSARPAKVRGLIGLFSSD